MRKSKKFVMLMPVAGVVTISPVSVVQAPRMDIYTSPKECQRRTKVYDICGFPGEGPTICKGDIFPTDCPLRKLPKEKRHG